MSRGRKVRKTEPEIEIVILSSEEDDQPEEPRAEPPVPDVRTAKSLVFREPHGKYFTAVEPSASFRRGSIASSGSREGASSGSPEGSSGGSPEGSSGGSPEGSSSGSPEGSSSGSREFASRGSQEGESSASNRRGSIRFHNERCIIIEDINPNDPNYQPYRYYTRPPIGSQEGAPSGSQEGAPSKSQEGAPSKSQEGAPSKSQEGAPSKSLEGRPSKSLEGPPSKSLEGGSRGSQEGASDIYRLGKLDGSHRHTRLGYLHDAEWASDFLLFQDLDTEQLELLGEGTTVDEERKAYFSTRYIDLMNTYNKLIIDIPDNLPRFCEEFFIFLDLVRHNGIMYDNSVYKCMEYDNHRDYLRKLYSKLLTLGKTLMYDMKNAVYYMKKCVDTASDTNILCKSDYRRDLVLNGLSDLESNVKISKSFYDICVIHQNTISEFKRQMSLRTLTEQLRI